MAALAASYRHDEPRGLASIAARYPSLQVVYNTVHAAKGLEWDYVVLSNVIAGKYGFPTEICDDPILELVLTGDKGAKNPEERRLFYVALTRARRKVFILTDPTCPSVFVKELEAQSGKMTLCPVCKTGFLVERSDGQFIGCDNYKVILKRYLQWKMDNQELVPGSYLLRTERSKQYCPSALWRRWKKYCPSHRLHDARHTNATMLYKASGNNLRLVQKQLGHSRITTTQVYADVMPDEARASMSAMEQMAGKSGKGASRSVLAFTRGVSTMDRTDIDDDSDGND